MQDPERREPLYPITTIEYGPEQVQRLEDYVKEAREYQNILSELFERKYETRTIELDIADDLADIDIARGQLDFITSLLSDARDGEKIKISDNGRDLEFADMGNIKRKTTVSRSNFNKFLNICWPREDRIFSLGGYLREYKENENNIAIQDDINISIRNHGRAILKPSPKIASAKASA